MLVDVLDTGSDPTWETYSCHICPETPTQAGGESLSWFCLVS